MAFNSVDLPWPTEFIHARAIATAAKATYNDAANAVELQRYDLPIGAPVAGPIGGTKGGLIKRLFAVPRASVAAATQLMLLSQIDGATYDLVGSVLMPVYTFTTATAVPLTPFLDPAGNAFSETNPLRLSSGQRLYFGSAVALAGGIVCHAEGDGYQ